MAQQLNPKLVSKPRAINAQLVLSNGNTFDIHQSGLIKLTFDRYLSDEANIDSGILQKLDITMFDKGGNDITSIIQRENQTIRLRYGFDDKLSEVYTLNILRMKATRGDTGTAIALGGIGVQNTEKFQAELYKPGALISDIIKAMAIRNNWELDIDVDIPITIPLLKTENETDFDFIRDKLLPIATRTALTTETASYSTSKFFDAKLYGIGTARTIHFRPKSSRGTARRVWEYSYGTSLDNQILDYTVDINMSHLIHGLTIQVSSNAVEVAFLQNEADLDTFLETMISDISNDIQEIHDKYNVPMLNLSNYRFNVELIDADIGEDNLEQDIKARILSAIDRAVSVINTLDLTVVGNPEIKPTDLIKLTVMNKDGSYDYLTTPSGSSTYWRVLKITEEIGANGYRTRLHLAKEILNK